MRITVFGATGGTGSRLLEQACAAGHQVTAVVRDPARLTFSHPELSVVRSDVMDPAAIQPHVAGRDAVVSAIGARSTKAPITVQTDSTTSILKAMADAGVRRFVVVSNSGMLTDGDGPVSKYVVKPILWRFLKHPWTDMGRMEDVVRASELDWTIIRPPMLTNGPRTAGYRTAVNRNVRGGNRISRADLADCVLRHLADRDSIRTAISVAN
ncbi:SDR family oxidoreductase [Saccharopolyspora sp. K220]|uniref:NAD(P)-dependent oxidoreductase n=1 Tax=Saccharopolyspora soli TaxID=2926618 RepID=UPI001F55AC42|nr:SDR family oxidoreductase [Saccharopolyspora soli]MCI2423715.1 SDR family oxidoreductase [Saccharopolyspora soli]